MTDSEQHPVPVTQSDREAAADFIEARCLDDMSAKAAAAIARPVREGKCDHCNEVQAFARHRLSHTPEPFQARVDAWMDACFGAEIKADVTERCDRFLEEALEFVQAAGYSAERAHSLVDYTLGRPQGEINQEVGGVMVTLAAMCNTLGVDIADAAETELARVWTKIDAIRAKQAAKPTGSALPVVVHTPEPSGDDVERVATLEALVYVPGVWRCAKCNFRLVQSNLNVRDGTVTARDEPGDKCPNDNSPLWRVTYRDELAEANVCWEQQVERAVGAEAETAKLREQVKVLRKALKPFAVEIGGQWEDKDFAPHYMTHRTFKVGDFRRARAALSATEGGE